MRTAAVGAALVSLLLSSMAQAQVKGELEPALRPYDGKANNIGGTLTLATSETFKRLLDDWTEQFRYFHKGVKFDVETIRDVDAPKAPMKGIAPVSQGADIVGLSYPLTDAEIREIKAGTGVDPIEVPVAVDAIVLVVHYKNPIAGLTLDQVAKIFAKPSKPEHDIETWKDVGVDGKFAGMHVNRYGRDATSGTYAAFRAIGLKGAEQRADVRAQTGSMSVVIEVGTDEAGIGYAATGYAARSKRVRIVPLAEKEGGRFVTPNDETLANGEYPLRRELYFYVMPKPDGKFSDAAREFMRFVLSRDGQTVVKEEGFFPLPSRIVEQALLRVNSHAMAGGPALRAQTSERRSAAD